MGLSYRDHLTITRPAPASGVTAHGTVRGGITINPVTGVASPAYVADADTIYAGPADVQAGPVTEWRPEASARVVIADGRAFLADESSAHLIRPGDLAEVAFHQGHTRTAEVVRAHALEGSVWLRWSADEDVDGGAG